MGMKTTGHWADHAAELGGASALGSGCGISAWLLGSLVDAPPLSLVVAAILIGATLGWLFVRNAGQMNSGSVLPQFELQTIPLGEAFDNDELLLDDPVPAPIATSRVVSLFGSGELPPTAGELQRRIDQHLGCNVTLRPTGPHLVPDASDALFEALADLRRSLRRG